MESISIDLLLYFGTSSKFSALIKELKVLMKKQGSILPEVEYLLRDYYNEATRVIKKIMESWINL